MNLPIPLPLIYAGLGGTLLALIVATATNGWQPRVLFLLALRLSIGWHFFFEGMHKIHSHMSGVTENSKPFTSEPYFAAAEGPLGPVMRKQFLIDTDAVIAERITPKQDRIAGFALLSEDDQAKLCPKSAADAIQKAVEEGTPDVIAAIGKAKEALAEAEAQASAIATKAGATAKEQDDAKKRVADANAKLNAATAKLKYLEGGVKLKAEYARWVYGVTRRDGKVKYVSTVVPQSVPERLAHIELLRKQLEEVMDHQSPGLGNGYDYERKQAAAARADLSAAKTELVADANAFIAELVKFAGGAEPIAPVKEIVRMDKITMWTITIVGACLLFGFFTPLSCLVGAGFLFLTYLAHPPFPWLPLPPNTEGNPLFINKNIIEMLALLAIAVHPTGRWLGLDALWTWLIFDNCKPDAPPATG